MKSIRKYISFLVILLGVSTLNLKAQQEGVYSQPGMENWVDERIDQWEDSVKRALYPVPEIAISPIDTGASNNFSDVVRERATNPSVSSPELLSVGVDHTKAVGEIPIVQSNSSSGSVSYQVPLTIYPGSGGVQPQLSLVYNSSGGNGRLGIGWDVSGLSRIMRVNKNIYYDGAPDGIKNSSGDAFMLDGVRLIKTSQTSSAIRYETEQGNVRVIAYLASNQTLIKYFKVFYPNGQKGIFGFESNTSVSYLEYPLTKLTDLHNNVINYAYQWSYNYAIEKISYGDNGGASVNFVYETTRTDPIVYYRGGMYKQENRLLKKIVCKYGSTILHTYELSYSTIQNCSVLERIDYKAGNQSFNPLVFAYGTGNNQSGYNQSTTQLYEWYVTNDDPGIVTYRKGKFDYGSDDDGIISYPTSNPYWNYYRHHTSFRHTRNRYDNLYPVDSKIYFYAGLKDNFASPIPYVLTGENFVDIFCANVDGKNEEEVVKVNNGINGNYDQLTFKVYRANLYAGLALKYTRTYNFNTVLTDADGGRSIHPKYYFTGDFNGNGKMEVLAVSCHHPLDETGINSQCYLFDLESNQKLYEGYVFPYVVSFVGSRQEDEKIAYENTDRLFVLDYDGDGKSDVCLINDQGTNIYTFDVSGSSYSMHKVATYTNLKKADLADRSLMGGEFDGDGLIDLLLSPIDSRGYTTWTIFHSMGNGQFYSNTFTGPEHTSNTSVGEVLQDINGDGLTDLISYNVSSFKTYLTRNGKPASLESTTLKTMNANPVSTNITSRNVFSQLITIKNGNATKFMFQRNDSREKMLTTAVSSLGIEYKNEYQRLNEENASFYEKGSGAVFPYENYNGPLWTLKATEVWMNGTRIENKSFRYTNAVIHKQGLGFRGFQKIEEYDYLRGRQSSQVIDPYHYSIPVSDESPFTKNTYQYSVNVQANKILKLRLTQKTSIDKVKGTTAVSSYQYDTFGNITMSSTNYGNSISVSQNNQYVNNTNDTGYLLGFLREQTTTNYLNGESSSTRSYISSYSNGLPIEKFEYVDGAQVLRNYYNYDDYGKIESISENRYSSESLTTLYHYDSFGHIDKETDPMAFKTEYFYTSSGLLDYTKNHKNQVTEYDYDSFGRLRTITDPLGLVKESVYSWDAAGINGMYCVTVTTTGEPIQKIWYDALGREVRTAYQRIDGQWQKNDKQYDGYGRLKKVSLPFIETSASLWDTYTYNDNDQPLSLTQASGKTITYSYNNLQTTTTVDGIATIRTYNVLGQLIKSEDPGGAIVYHLRPDGQPSSIVAPGNVTTRFSYDQYGRQDSIIDPSAGIVTYGYDAAGNLNKQTNAEGKTTNMVFDKYGRIKTKNCAEFSTTYTYKTNDDLLESVNSDNGSATAYVYDTYGRLMSEKETGADGIWLEKAYQYKTDGNTANLTYKTNSGTITSEYYYYTNGILSEIKLNGTTSIFKLDLQNSLGQPSRVITGNFNRIYNYNAYGMPTGRRSGNFLNADYNFDTATGNLLSRKDGTRNLTENFLYDGLNRLTNYGANIAAYDTGGKGNLISKTDVGSFYYKYAQSPYAMSGAEVSNNAVPPRQQEIVYTSFEQPETISENNYLGLFTYNANGQRMRMEIRQGTQTILKRDYLGNCYEKDHGLVENKEKLYLGGDFYSAPAVYVKQGTGNWQLYYICRDYLGSITHLVDGNGSLTQELSFDPWGRLRNPATQVAYTPDNDPELFLGRGYTGHEHLPWFGLINMNGRLYDPAVGRFLSADSYVQVPDFSQSYNRYSYCFNNPLMYTDPSGELIWVIPNIGWSKEGGLSVGVSVVFGLPGAASAQVGVGYNFKSNDVYGYAGATLAMNTVYTSVSSQSGWSAGYTAGASMFSGLPISTNLLTAGANYNISNDSWSGNLSSWQVDQSGWSFDPSVSVMVCPEQTTNLVRGQGFRSNDAVLNNFVDAGNYQGALDYFGFEGRYIGTTSKASTVGGTDFYGYTDPKTGDIMYGNLAFDSFDRLNMTYNKEMYHSLRVKKGITLESQGTGFGKSLKYYPEERLGFIDVYKKQGLFPSLGRNILSNINFYQSQCFTLSQSQYFTPKWWHFVYKTPRLW